MKVYIMVDLEGISGIYTSEQVLPDGAKFTEGRRYVTDDINACISGLKDGDTDEIYVHDCHGGGFSVIWNEISSDASFCISGNTAYRRFCNLEECDAIILLGYHAMAGTYGATLEHTFNSKRVQNMYLNGEKVGEIGIDAAIAGEMGKPVIMVSGDDKACAEAKAILPHVVTAEVKKGMSTQGAMLLTAERAHKIIRESARFAVENFKNSNPYIVNPPVSVKVELTERSPLPYSLSKPYMKIIDGRSFEVTGESVEEAYFRALY